MSGVGEASLVLGLISSLIQIIAAAKDVYDAAHDASGLPKAFRDVAAKLDIIQLLLEEAEKYIQNSDVEPKTYEALTRVLESCKKRAHELHEIFTKVIPKDGASRIDRYLMAARKLGKGGRVENLVGEIFKELSLLATYFSFPESTKKAIARALEEVLMIEPSLPESFANDSVTSIELMERRQKTLREFRYQSSQNHSKLESVSQDELKDFLHTWMAPDTSTNYISDQTHHLGKRFRNPDTLYTTCDWFFQTSEFLEFLDPSTTSVLRVRASPGCGKSVLSAAVIDRIQREQAACVLYCYLHRDPEPTSSMGLVRTLLAQTLQFESPKIVAELSKLITNHPTINTNDGKIEEELWTLLRVFMSTQTRKVFLFVDGLDECAQPLLCVKSLIKIMTRLAATTKPSLLISSRLEARDVFDNKIIKTPLTKSGIQASQVEITEERTCLDVKEFVSHRVASHSAFTSKSSKIKQKIIQGVCERANGMFLYASLVLDDLKGNRISSISAIDTTLAKLPRGLFDSYKQNLEVPRNSMKGPEAFCWIFCSNPAMTWHELKSAIAIGDLGYDENEIIDDSCEAFIEHSCGRLVETFGPSDSFRFIHPTVKDFLVDRLDSDGPGVDIGIAKAHSLVARKLLSFLEYPDLPFFSSSVDANPEEIITAYNLQTGRGLYSFATFNWYRHLKECDKNEDADLEELVMGFLASPSFIRWLKSAIIMSHSTGKGDSVSLTVDVINSLQGWVQGRSWSENSTATRMQTWIQDFLYLMLDWGSVLQTQPDWVHYLHHQLLSGNSFREILEDDGDQSVIQFHPGRVLTKSAQTVSWPNRSFAVDLERDLAFTYDEPFISCYHMRTGLHTAEISIPVPSKLRGPLAVRRGALCPKGKYLAVLFEALGPSSDPLGAQIRAGQILSFNDTTCKFSWSLEKAANLGFPAFMMHLTFGVDNAEFLVCLLELNHSGPARTNLFGIPSWATTPILGIGTQTMRWELDDVDVLGFSSDSSKLATPFGIVNMSSGEKRKPWSFALDTFFAGGKLTSGFETFATVSSWPFNLDILPPGKTPSSWPFILDDLPPSETLMREFETSSTLPSELPGEAKSGGSTSTIQLLNVSANSMREKIDIPGIAHILAISNHGRFFLLLRVQIADGSKARKPGLLPSQQGSIGIWDCCCEPKWTPLLLLEPPASGQRTPWDLRPSTYPPCFSPEAKEPNEINKILLYAPPKWKLAKNVSPYSALDPQQGHLLLFEAKRSTTPAKGFGNYLMLKLQLSTASLSQPKTDSKSQGLNILSWSPHFDLATVYYDSKLSTMTRAQLKESVSSVIENRKLTAGPDTNQPAKEANACSVFLTPLDRSATFLIQISLVPPEERLQQLLPTNDSHVLLHEHQYVQYTVSVSCLRGGESLATFSTFNHITAAYPPLELQYICSTTENGLNLGCLQLELFHSYDGMKLGITDPKESVFRAAQKSFKIQAQPLKHTGTLSSLIKSDEDGSVPRYAIFDEEEITFESDCSPVGLARHAFLVKGASTIQDHRHVFEFSRLIDKKPENRHEARQFEVFLCVFNSLQNRISWLMHTTTGGDISQSKSVSPEMAWALHPTLPLLVWHIPGHRLRISNIDSKDSPINIAESLTMEVEATQAVRFSPNGRYIAVQARQEFKNDLMNFRNGQTLWSVILCDLIEGKTIEATLASESNLSIELGNEMLYTYRLTRDGAIESTIYKLPNLELSKRQYLTFIPAHCCCQTCGKPFEPQCHISIIEHQEVKSVVIGHTPMNIGRANVKIKGCEPLILRITSPPVDRLDLGGTNDLDNRFVTTSSRIFLRVLKNEDELLEDAFVDSRRHCEKPGPDCSCSICTAEPLPDFMSMEHRGIPQIHNVIFDFQNIRKEPVEPGMVEEFLREMEKTRTKQLRFTKSAEVSTRSSLLHYKKILGDDYFPWDSWEEFHEAMEHVKDEFDFNSYMEGLFEPGKCGIGCNIPLFINTFSFEEETDSGALSFHWSSAISVGWIEEDLKWFYDRLFGGDFEGARMWYPFPAYCALNAKVEKLKSDKTPKGARFRKVWAGAVDPNERETLVEISLPEREGSNDKTLDGPKSRGMGGILFPLKLKEIFQSLTDVVPGFENFFEQRLRTMLNQSLIGEMVEEDIT